MNTQQTILILGKPDSSKTTFKTQLLNRLLDGENTAVVLDPIPDDQSQVMQDRNTIKSGCAVQRTPSQVKIQTSLSLKFPNGKHVILPYHDYAGEEIDFIIKKRIVSDEWAKRIKESQAWFLFICPHHFKTTDNIYTNPSVIKDQKPNDAIKNDFEPSDTAYYIELLQILLFIKGRGTFQPIKEPVLQIALSRCDKIGLKEGMIPRDILKDKLPLLVDFLESVWDKNSLTFIGLSPTGKELSHDGHDDDFIDEGAHNFGYIILPDGKKSKDLTLAISNIVNRL